MTLVDSHCHLDFPEFREELDAVVRRANEAGVGWMLSIGTHVTRYAQVLAVAHAYDNVFCTVGIHPHEAAKEPEVSAEHLVRLASDPKVVGIGETGLDYYYERSARDAQARAFRTHIRAARTAQLPLIVHARDADEEVLRVLEDEHAKGPFSGVLHCFTGGRALAEGAIALGLYVSFSGILTFKNADPLRTIATDLPLERLLVETDAPYLAPVPMRGKRNEPSFVVHTAACLAEIRGLSPEAVAEATTANFFRLFGKAAAVAGRLAKPSIPAADRCA